MERRGNFDPKEQGKILIKHYVVDGFPGENAIRNAGAKDQVGYYQGVIQTIMGWSGLSLEDVEIAVAESPDTIENSDLPNFKPLYFEAIRRMRSDFRRLKINPPKQSGD